ncbi:MAG: hypothetical protein Q7S48_03860 [bacterium]|nr:hypothetical protein [bacterium]
MSSNDFDSRQEEWKQIVRQFRMAFREDPFAVGEEQATRQRWSRSTHQLYVLHRVGIILSFALMMLENYLGVGWIQDGKALPLPFVFVCVAILFLPTIVTHAVFRIRGFRITIPSKLWYGLSLGYGFGLSASAFVFFLAHQFYMGIALIMLTALVLFYVEKRCFRWLLAHPQGEVMPDDI